MKCRHANDVQRTRMFGVHQESNNGTIFIKIGDARPHEMPLMITNNSFAPIRIHQSQPGRTILGLAPLPSSTAGVGASDVSLGVAKAPKPQAKRGNPFKSWRSSFGKEDDGLSGATLTSWASRVAIRRVKPQVVATGTGAGAEIGVAARAASTLVTGAVAGVGGVGLGTAASPTKADESRRDSDVLSVEADVAAATLQRRWRRNIATRQERAATAVQRVIRGALTRRAFFAENDSMGPLPLGRLPVLLERLSSLETYAQLSPSRVASASPHGRIRGKDQRSSSQRDEAERRRANVGSLWRGPDRSSTKRRSVLPSRKRRLANWDEEVVGVDVIMPGATYPYAWDFPEGALRLEIRGRCLETDSDVSPQDWWTSITTSHPFTVRQIGGASDVVVSLTDIAGPLKLLEISGGMPITSLKPQPIQLPKWLRHHEHAPFVDCDSQDSVVDARVPTTKPPKPPSRMAVTLRGSLTSVVRALMQGGQAVRRGARRGARAIQVEAQALRSVVQGYLAPPEALPLILLQATKGSRPRSIVRIEFVCSAEQLNISLVNGAPRELLRLALHEVRLGFTQDLASALQPVIEANVAIGHLQLDNQLHRASLPVVLAPASAASRPGERNRRRGAAASDPTLEMDCRFNQMVGVDSFQHVTVRVAPLSLMLEESLLFEMLVFVSPLIDSLNLVRDHPSGVGSELPIGRLHRGPHVPMLWEWPLVAPGPQPNLERQVVVDVCSISALSIDVTLRAAGEAAGHGQARALLSALLTIFGNIDHFPLRVRPHTMRRHLSSWDEFTKRLATHYAIATAPSAITLLLSLNLTGGVPELLLSALSGLYRALLVPPAVALFGTSEERMEVIDLLAEGCLDLGRKVILLPSLFLYRVTSALSELLALCTLSTGYMRKHTAGVYASEVPLSVSDGFEDGVGLLIAGIVGLGGVISKPYQGALYRGPRGLAEGLVKGALCVLKPPIGVIDLLTKSCEGLKNSSMLGTKRHTRQQPPFALHPDRLVKPFNEEEARAYALLSLCSNRLTFGRTEFFQHVHPIELRTHHAIEQRVVLVTTLRVAYGRLDPLELIFEVRLTVYYSLSLAWPFEPSLTQASQTTPGP